MAQGASREAEVAAYIQRYGHDWTDPERVREYVDRTDAQMEERSEGFKYMAAFVPFEHDEAIRILDVGSGQGSVAAAILDTFPHAEAVGLDVSEPMMELAMERMASYGRRYRYSLGDFADGELPTGIGGPFEVVVSSRAIHHLPGQKKAILYKDILKALVPGGCFFNLDTVAPGDDYLAQVYRQASRNLGNRPRDTNAPRGQRPALGGHYYESAATHLGYLTDAGFAPVDVFFKRMNNALIGGYKPGGQRPLA